MKFRVSDNLQVPQEIKEMENGVKLAMDIMYIQSVMFLVTTLIGIRLVTVSYLPTRQKKDLYSVLDSVL